MNATEWAKFGAEWALIAFLVIDVRKWMVRMTLALERLSPTERRDHPA